MPTAQSSMRIDRTEADLACTRPLVLCADDYAVHAPASAGILDLARRRRLSATSAMVLSPRWSDDAAALREMRGQLDVGLHLDFTSPMACEAGWGRPLGGMMWRTLWPLGATLRQRWQDAIERQCDAFELHWHAAPDHVDGHQHVQQFPGLRDLVLDVLGRRYRRQPWLRVSEVAQPGWKSAIITRWGARAWRQQLQVHGWRGLAPLRGVYDFTGGRDTYARLMRGWLTQTHPEGGVIMCHPAQGVGDGDPIGLARTWEHAYLSSDVFAHDLRAAGWHLARGSALHSAS